MIKVTTGGSGSVLEERDPDDVAGGLVRRRREGKTSKGVEDR